MFLAWRSAVALDRAAAPTPTPPPSNFEIFDAAATVSQKLSATRRAERRRRCRQFVTGVAVRRVSLCELFWAAFISFIRQQRAKGHLRVAKYNTQ